MKRVLTAGAGLLALSGTAQAQVSVFDWAGLVQAVKDYGIQLQQQAVETKQLIGDQLSWATQAQQYAMQGQQYITEATQLAGFIHDPNLGAAMGLLNHAGLGSTMPVSPYAVMGVVNGVQYGAGGLPQMQGILGSLSGFSTTAYTANHVYTPTDGTWTSQQIIANGNSIAGTQGTALTAYQDLTTHAGAFQALRDNLSAATDPKDVADAQAEIALEQTWTTNEAAKLTAAQLTYQAQQASREQQASEQITRSLDNQLVQARAEGIIP
jgi:type IV secretion system protein VirB5